MVVATKLAARAACVLLAVSSGGVASAQLLNSSFEAAGSLPGPDLVFADWTDFGNSLLPPNISRSNELFLDGSFSAKMYGQFTGDFNVCGIFQDLPTTVDQVWDAQAFFQHQTGDTLGVGNRLAMNVEFRASNGDLLEYWTVDALTETSPADVWIQQQFSATAPDEAVVARMAFLFVQPDIEAGAGYIDDAFLASKTTSELLINPGFEDFGGFGAAYSCRGWAQFPRFASNIFQNSDMPRTGTFAGFMYGQFTGSENYNGFFQTFAVAEGDQVDATVWALHKSTDPIAAGNFGFINLEFLDGAGALIGSVLTNPGIDSASPTNVYSELPVSGVAPVGSERVRVVIGYYQQALGGGGVHYDDAVVAISSPPSFCVGDANGNGIVDFDDITSVIANWLAIYAPGSAGAGDANNDGFVNFDDINAVIANFNQPCP